jgi:hypothetical protein
MLTIEIIQKLKFKLLLHPAYSPDLTLSYYRILDGSEMCYMNADLQTMKRSRMWCMCGFACNQKHSLQMASGSCGLKYQMYGEARGTVLKNDSIFVVVYLW